MSKDLKKDLKAVKDSVEKVVNSEEAKKAVKAVQDTTETVVKTAKETATQVVKKVSNREVKPEVYVQYADHESKVSSLCEKVFEDFRNKNNDSEEITDIKLYIKPEEGAVYYVVNNVYNDKINLW